MHVGRLGAGGRSHYRPTSLLQQLGFLLWVVFMNFRGIRTEQRAGLFKVGLHGFRSACSTSENTPVGSAATIPEGGSGEWQEALLRRSSPPHTVIRVSPLHAAHTHLPKRRVFTSLSLHFAYVNMPPKGAALDELVTKQPEITAKFAHKVGVKNPCLYMSR